MASQNVVEFTTDNFENEVLQSDKPVLVDFWAEWCPPCRALSPTIDKLADQYAGKVKIGKVDTDSNQDLAARYHRDEFALVLASTDGPGAFNIAERLRLSIEELQIDLDAWLCEYNEQRPHQGRWCFGKTPMQTFLDSVKIAQEKQLAAREDRTV